MILFMFLDQVHLKRESICEKAGGPFFISSLGDKNEKRRRFKTHFTFRNNLKYIFLVH